MYAESSFPEADLSNLLVHVWMRPMFITLGVFKARRNMDIIFYL